MDRVAVVVTCWFALWIGVCVAFGTRSIGLAGFYSGALAGMWIATLLSFLWPLIMPEAINRWMDS